MHKKLPPTQCYHMFSD